MNNLKENLLAGLVLIIFVTLFLIANHMDYQDRQLETQYSITK